MQMFYIIYYVYLEFGKYIGFNTASYAIYIRTYLQRAVAPFIEL